MKTVKRYYICAAWPVKTVCHLQPPILVIDDGSIDNTNEIANSFQPHLCYQYQPNGGVGSAMSVGVELANGESIAFLDSDDLWLRDKLERQMEVFISNPSLDVVFSRIEQFYSADMLPELKQKYRCADKIIDGYHIDTMLARRDVFYTVGNFNPDRKTGAFIDWYARAKELDLQMEMIPVVMAKRRIHNNNMGIRNRENQRKGYAQLLKSALDRRRANKTAVTDISQSQ